MRVCMCLCARMCECESKLNLPLRAGTLALFLLHSMLQHKKCHPSFAAAGGFWTGSTATATARWEARYWGTQGDADQRRAVLMRAHMHASRKTIDLQVGWAWHMRVHVHACVRLCLCVCVYICVYLHVFGHGRARGAPIHAAPLQRSCEDNLARTHAINTGEAGETACSHLCLPAPSTSLLTGSGLPPSPDPFPLPTPPHTPRPPPGLSQPAAAAEL